MKIAVNYSTALLSLLLKNQSLGIDYIKAPIRPFPDCWEQFEDSQFNLARLPHLAQIGVLLLGHPIPEQRFNARIVNKVLKCTNPPYLSTHLETREEFFPEFKEYLHQNHPVVQKAFKAYFLKVIKEVKAQINLPLILENCPYYTWWGHYRLTSEPQFINEICTESESGFLLDIAHARCSAWHMGMDLLEYINGLPLSRLREIHLGGVKQRKNEGMRDTHTALCEEDYRLLEYVLARTSPETITIEYGGMPDFIINLQREQEPIIRNSTSELQQIISRVQTIIGVRV